MEWKMMKKSAAAVKQEMKADDSINGDEGGGENNYEKVEGGKPVYSEDTAKASSSSPNQTDPAINKKEDQLESTKAAMSEVREENERLKTILGQIVKDYQSLQLHFFDIMKKDQASKKQTESDLSSPTHNEQVHEEHELVSLCLGSTSRSMKKKAPEEKPNHNGKTAEVLRGDHIKEGLTLALECKMEGKESDASFKSEVQLSLTPENSSEGTASKEDAATGETWPPSKALKGLKRGEDEAAPQAHVKRARVSVRARCDAPTMNDGCQWRKYGQKIAKGNPCPRAYYRCTVAPGCPVRKQVQRCSEDMSILITTYEGNHNHPLPTSATAMASTTAAAACMLTSGSSSSLSATAQPHSTVSAGLNFSLPDSSHPNRQFYLTNPCISPSPSQPTITLDLTNPSAAAVQSLNRFSSSSSRSFYSPGSFSFSPSDSSSWSSRSAGYFSYGAQEPSYYKSYNMGALRQSQESLFHSYAQKNPLTDTIAKAITADPSFQSALAAAITSYVGGSTVAAGEPTLTSGGGLGVLKWGEQLQLASSLAGAPATVGNNGYMHASSSSNSGKPQGSLLFLPPTSKNGASGSPRDTC